MGLRIADAARWWPDRRMPFEIAPNAFTAAQLQIVQNGIAQWNNASPVPLVPRAGEADYVVFRPAPAACGSPVGRQGGPQDVTCAVGAGFNFGAIMHEAAHAAGIYHEHQRQDRDNFVQIQAQNIQAGQEHNFAQHIGDADDLGFYDYGSIMHYGGNAFSATGQPTIVPLQGGVAIGQNNQLSAGDIFAIGMTNPAVVSYHRIHSSGDGNDLGGGPIHYEGSSPITTMIEYNGGVLTAFSNAGPQGHRVHWSPNGEDLGGGPIRYDGVSPVTAMVAYGGGVLTAFSNAGPQGHRVHWSPNGEDLGGGEIRYDGTSPVVAMVAYNSGVLTAFTNAGPFRGPLGGGRVPYSQPGPPGQVIHWSQNGHDLGGGDPNPYYNGNSPVTAMSTYGGGVLTAFSHAGPQGHRIHWSQNGTDLGGGSPRYDGNSPVTAMTSLGNVALTAFFRDPREFRGPLG